MSGNETHARLWSTILIVLGVGLLCAVFVSAFMIVRDPGASFDRWVPGEETAGPQAGFSWASSGLNVEFGDTSVAGDAELVARVWHFGDATTDDEASNPEHRYGEDGEYAVRLEVTDANGVTSRAEATVGVEAGAENAGQGEPGLAELADSVTSSVERIAKGGGIVLLVIGLFVVMVMAGGRLLKQGVTALRPIPERISVKVRPREMERDLHVDVLNHPDGTLNRPSASDEHPAAAGDAAHDRRSALGV